MLHLALGACLPTMLPVYFVKNSNSLTIVLLKKFKYSLFIYRDKRQNWLLRQQPQTGT